MATRRHKKQKKTLIPTLYRTVKKTPLFLIAFSSFAVAAGFFVYERWPESTPVSRGQALITTAGCYACHGRGEGDPRANIRDAGTDRMSARSIPTFADLTGEDRDELIEWITLGCPDDHRDRHDRLLIQMPAYGTDGHLTSTEVDDITSWIMAEGLRLSAGLGNADEDIPAADELDPTTLEPAQLVLLGDRLSRQNGCYQCHGELGQGGVANPASFKGTIPGFAGADFRKLTANNDPAEIRHWIEHGRGLAIESGLLGGIAKRYFDRQAIPMPGYAEVLNEYEITILVDYLRLLNARGPLDSSAIESFVNELSDSL